MGKNTLFFLGIGLLTLFITAIFTSNNLLQIIILFGQAHFLSAYIYIYNAGKFTGTYKSKFWVLLALFGLIAVLIFESPHLFNYLIVGTFLLFVYHYFLDEMKMFQSDDLILKNFGSISVVSCFLIFFIEKLFSLSAYYLFSLIFFVMLLASITLFRIIQKRIWANESWCLLLFWFLNIVLPIIAIFLKIDLLKVAGFIIVFHYLRWYLYYFDKFYSAKNWKKLNEYLNIVFSVHLVVILSFILYNLEILNYIFILFFHPIYFYLWTSLHILLSLSWSDFKIKLL